MNLENIIATQAQQLVSEEQEHSADHPAETKYRSLCEGFPIMLRTFGLAQTLAFLRPNDTQKPEKRKEHGRLYDDLELQFTQLGLITPGQELSSVVTSLDLRRYRLYSQLALRIAFWHKRLAQALLRSAGK